MFILSEERKSSKINKISETKKSRYTSSGAANAGNNKNKEYNQKKNTSRVITTLSVKKYVLEVHPLQTGWSLCN